MSYRILPLEFFAVLEGLLVLSLLHAPAPWLAGYGGYSPLVLLVSVVLGVGLASVAFAHSIMGWIGFKTHRVILFAMGLLCLTSSALWLDAIPSARAIFLVYGLLMTASSLFVSDSAERIAHAASHGPESPTAAPQMELPRARDRRAA